jgi:F-type H+-transporting ATPase subunit delta
MPKRIKTIDLAETLFQITEGKTHAEIEKIIQSFVKLIVKNGQAGNLNRIIERYEELCAKKHNILNISVSTVTELGKDNRENLEQELKKKYKADKVAVNEIIDQKNIGGMKIKIGDTVYDYTLAGRLKQLQTQLVK